MIQLKGIAFVAVFAPVMTVIILSILKLVFGSLRVSDEEEFGGLDLSQHSESAYTFGTGGSVLAEVGSLKGSPAGSLGVLSESTKLA